MLVSSRTSPVLLLAALLPLALLAVSGRAVESPAVPPIEHPERLASWRAGVAAADSQERPLQVVCMGDSNTENPGYVCELRRLLQGCYGERGIGYHSLGDRALLPESPKIERNGAWELLRDAPKGPPPPRFALDGIWCQTSDAGADLAVEFVHGSWAKAADALARPYDLQQRVRIHYQVGPGLGNFAVFTGPSERLRVACAAEAAGYAVTDPFLCDGFRIAGIQGKVTLLGIDAERVAYRQGQPLLKGGALVHALGKSWGRTEEPARLEESAYAAFFAAIRPDLITILLGTNDQHNDGRVSAYRDWLTTILRRLQEHAPGVGVLVIACPEAAQTRPGLAVQFRDAAREVAAANGASFWSLQDLVGPRAAAWTAEGFFADGLHYNAIGGSVIARMLLRQLGFDLGDLRHYPVLREAARAPETDARPALTVPRLQQSAVTLETVADALGDEPPLTLWVNQVRVAELRLGLTPDALAVHAVVRDAQCAGPRERWAGGSFELCVANPTNTARVKHNEDGPVVRQVAFQTAPPGAKPVVRQFTMDERNTVVPWASERAFPCRMEAVQPFGYELRALVPLDILVLAPDCREFLVECAVSAAAAPGLKPAYSRLFATHPDAGAFRDASQSARVRVTP